LIGEICNIAGGWMTVPKNVRDTLRYDPGSKVAGAVAGGQAVLRRKNKAIKDLAGMFYDRDRQPVTIEEMNDAVADGAAESGALGSKHSRDGT